MVALIPIDHKSVTVLGSKWKADAPWGGLDFKKAVLRERGPLGTEDHHLDVPWCHPDDQPEGWEDECWYRVRPASAKHHFVRKRGMWWLTESKLRARQGRVEPSKLLR